MDLEGQIQVPTEDTLGPKMRALNGKQRRFVCALAVFGNDRERAYKFAGYGSTTPGALQASSSRLYNSEAVKEAIDEYYRDSFFVVGRAVAIRTLIEAASETNLSMKERIKASKEILDRVPGYSAKSEHNVTVKHEASTEELIAIIQEHAPRLGLDAAKLLEDKGVVIDAEYDEIPAGLEDIF